MTERVVLARSRLVLLATLAVVAAGPARGAGPAIHAGLPSESPDTLLVRFRDGVSLATGKTAAQAAGAVLERTYARSRVHRLRVGPLARQKVRDALSKDPRVAWVEADGLAYGDILTNDPVPTDRAWHIPFVSLDRAWDVTTGSAAVPIAIIDSGVLAGHPDLAGKVLPGFNLIHQNADTSDVWGHGTAVAGVAAAIGNNGIGVAGVAWQSPVLPLVAANAAGRLTYSDLVNGIEYAVDHGVRVINISASGDVYSRSMCEAVAYATTRGAVVVCSAGNEGNDLERYPAACPGAVAVAATDSSDEVASFSTRGSWVTLAAPGRGIWSTTWDGGYDSWTGTSFSAPMVAGAVALMLGVNPALTGSDAIALLKATADDLGAAGPDAVFGAGRLNVQRAVLAAAGQPLPPDTTPPTLLDLQVYLAGGLAPVVDGMTVDWAGSLFSRHADAESNVVRVDTFIDGALISLTGPTESWMWQSELLGLDYFINYGETEFLTNGPHEVRLVSHDTAGNLGVTAFGLTVQRGPRAGWVAHDVTFDYQPAADGYKLTTSNLNIGSIHNSLPYVIDVCISIDGQVVAAEHGRRANDPVYVDVPRNSLSQGTHLVVVRCENADGQVSELAFTVVK
jgi:thermitase